MSMTELLKGGKSKTDPDLSSPSPDESYDEGCCSSKCKCYCILITILILLLGVGVLVTYFIFFYKSVPYPYNMYKVNDLVKNNNRNYSFTLGNTREKIGNDPRNLEMKTLRADVVSMHDHHLNIRIYDPKNVRWQVKNAIEGAKNLANVVDVDTFINTVQHYSFEDLGVKFSNEPFGWELWGTEKQRIGTPLVSAKEKALSFFDKSIEFEVGMPCTMLFGMPQASKSVIIEKGTYTLWNSYKIEDSEAEEGNGGINFLLCKTKDSTFLGVYLESSNAQSVRVDTTGTQATLNYKIAGGIIDFSVFYIGDATAIIKFYQEYIGRPIAPPFWVMGLHQSRTKYNDVKALEEVVNSYTSNSMPIDSLMMDQTLMENHMTYTVDKTRYVYLKEKLKLWKDIGIHFTPSILPHIKKADYPIYNDTIESKAFIHDAAKTPPVDEVVTKGRDVGECIFIDFFNSKGKSIAFKGIQLLYDALFVDGVWIRQDSPHTTCDGYCTGPSTSDKGSHDPKEFDNPPFAPVKLNAQTLPLASYHSMSNVSENISDQAKHFNIHNVFSTIFAKVVRDFVRDEKHDFKVFIMSSVAGPHLGSYASLWRGDIIAEWSKLSQIIVDTVNYNMAGIPIVGFPVCGFTGVSEADKELCFRWYQLAAFLPLFQIRHNGANPVEPFVFKSSNQVKFALQNRYRYARFMFTKIAEAELWGGSVWEPIGFLFPKDNKCFAPRILHETFIIGKTLYVTPSINKGERKLSVYLPNSNWYSMIDYNKVYTYDPNRNEGQDLEFASEDHTNVFIKGGSIIPIQNGNVLNTNDLTNKEQVTIIIAPDHLNQAKGTMLISLDVEDDLQKGPYIHFSFTYANNTFRSNFLAGHSFPMQLETMNIKEILIIGYESTTTKTVCMLDTELNFRPIHFSYDPKTKILKITDQDVGHIILRTLESITIGDGSKLNMCGARTTAAPLTYTGDKKKATTELTATDLDKITQKYNVVYQLLNDNILYYSAEINDGEKHWKVPDVVDQNIRDNPKANINLDAYKLTFGPPSDPYWFGVEDFIDPSYKVLSTFKLPFNYKNRFIHFGIRYYGGKIFGLGERIHGFELQDGWYSLFAKGIASKGENRKRPGNNAYGSHPFYLVQMYKKKSDFVGVFILNSNAIDIKIKHEGYSSMVLTHVLSGGMLEMFFFQKASAEDVIKQYHLLIGKPTLVPHWAFGYHQSRWGYDTQKKLEEVVENFEKNKIPLDVLWSDIDYMKEYQDFTVDVERFPKMKEFLETLKNKNIYYVPIIDAGIARKKGYKAYDDGVTKKLFIKSSDTKEDLVGIVWPGYAVFTDFTHPEAESYWINNLNSLHDILPFDGIWLDMNEATNFCDGECPDELHYTFETYPITNNDNPLYYPTHCQLDKMTLSMSGVHNNGETEYNLHSLYGFNTMKVTNKYFANNLKTRPFILSRSTYPGSGRFGSHWTGDNYARKEFMSYSISGIYNFHMFGIPLVGADVCGFIEPVDLALCKRWMQLGAFYPFYRNHKEKFWGSQEPYVDKELALISTHAIQTRYSLFRYLYSRYFEVALNGGTFFRPLFWEFPLDTKAYEYNDNTFLIGPGLKISPALDPDKNVTFEAYFPNANWYNIFNYKKDVSYVENAQIGTFIHLPCGYNPPVLNAHLRGGYIIPLGIQKAANLVSVMKNHINILIAPFNNKADGVIYYDEDTINTIEGKKYFEVKVNYVDSKISVSANERTINYKYLDDFVDSIVLLDSPQFEKTTIAVLTPTKGNVKNIPCNFLKDVNAFVLNVGGDVKVDEIKTITWVKN